MQTFLPYPSFIESASVLDNRRLGKQRVETKQILRALRGETRGWVNHPATRMWRGHEGSLCSYGAIVCHYWWDELGYADSLMGYFLRMQMEYNDISPPDWLGDVDFHLSHQSNLIRKDPEFYGPLFPGVPDDLPYIWPV